MKSIKINSIFITIGILLASLLTSCTSNLKHSSDRFYEKEYDIEEFNQIKFEGAYNIKLTQSETPFIIMETSEEFHNKVKIWVENDLLRVKTDVKNIGADEIRLQIGVNKLEYIKIEGGALLSTDGYLEFEDLEVKIEGGANIDMKLKVNSLYAHAEGAVNMEFEGIAEKLTAISEGAGNIDADGLKAKYVDCRVAGVGNASVYATENLQAKVEGLGKIAYRGNPTVNKHIEGIGLIYKK